MNAFPKSVIRLLAVFLAACWACGGESQAPGPAEKERGLPTLDGLDANADGTINDADSAIFERVAEQARDQLGEARYQELRLGPYTGHGEAGLEKLFDAITWTSEGEPVIESQDERTLFALAVEGKWLSNHARLSSASPAPVDDWGTGGALVESFLHYDQDRITPATLCASIDALHPETLASEGLRPVAVLDLDDTVWSGQSIDAFLAAAIELNLIHDNDALQRSLQGISGIDPTELAKNSAGDNAKIILERSRSSELPESWRVSRRDQFFLVAELMAGLTQAEVKRVADYFFLHGSAEYPPWIGQIFASEDGCGMREILEALQAKGIEVYIISASLQPIVDVAGDFLGVDAARRKGSVMQIENGIYTGEVESLFALKASIVRAWLGGPALIAFGDSVVSDFGFMDEVAGPVFMVNPDEAFLAHDAQHAGGRFVALEFPETAFSLSATQKAASSPQDGAQGSSGESVPSRDFSDD